MIPNVIVAICVVLICRADEWSLCHGECCYHLGTQPENWQSGHDYCEGMDSDYASIHSAEENAYVSGTVCNGKNCWLGLTDVGSSSVKKWEWADGSPMDYTSWAAGEPDGCCGQSVKNGGYYGGLSNKSSDNKWHDLAGSTSNKFYALCKKCNGERVSQPTKAPTPVLSLTHDQVKGWVISSLDACLEIMKEVHSFRDEVNRNPRRRTDDEKLDDEHLAAQITEQLEACAGIVGAVHSFQEQHSHKLDVNTVDACSL